MPRRLRRHAAVGCSGSRSVHDLTVLRLTKLVERLRIGAGAMMDKGYVGIGGEHPDRPLTDEQKAGIRVIASHRIVVEHSLA